MRRPQRFERTALRAACVAAGLALLASGCDRGWNRSAHESVAAAVERINRQAAASKAEPPAARPPVGPNVRTGEVPLALAEALRIALAHNPEVQVAGYEPVGTEADIARAWAAYEPSLFASNSFGRTDRPIQNQLDTGVLRRGALIEDTWALKAGLKQRGPTGGTFSLFQDMNYLDTNSRLVLPNPQVTSHLTAELAQPLLKGFGDTTVRAAIRIAYLGAGASLHDFRQKVMEVAAKVVSAYWQLTFDREAARITRETLDLAREVLRRETVRRAQGVSNDLSLSRAASAVATREAELVRGDNRVRTSADQLKRLLAAPDLPVEGDALLVPADAPRYFLVEVDRTGAMTRALARRPELERARAAIAINRIRVDAAGRERLPKLDAALRYTVNGLGGRVGEALDSQHLDGPFSWSAGLEFEMPLGNRLAEADHQKRRVEYEQALLQAAQLTDQILTEVSIAVRGVLQGREEVESTLRAEDASRKVVHGEKVRFELGEMTNEELLRSQENLAAAERDHVMALLNFNLALTELARAQGTLMEDHGIDIVWPQWEPGRIRPLALRMTEKKAEPPPPETPATPTPTVAENTPAPAAQKPAEPATAAAENTPATVAREKPTPILPILAPDVVVARHNAWAASIQRLSSRAAVMISVAAADPNQPPVQRDLDGHLAFEKPDRLSVRAQAQGQDALAIGMNAEKRWLWMPSRADTVWVGARAGAATGRLPVAPEDLMTAMGLFPVAIERGDKAEFVVQPRYYVLTEKGGAAAGIAPVRRVWFDRQTLRPARVGLYDEDGRCRMMAELLQYERVGDRDVCTDCRARFYGAEEVDLALRLSGVDLERRESPRAFEYRAPPGAKEADPARQGVAVASPAASAASAGK